MKDEYIIINKTVLKKRIEGLEKQIRELKRNGDGNYTDLPEDLKKELEDVLSQSIPLIPEIEKAFWEGHQYESQNLNRQQKNYMSKLAKNYISNLKLDI